MTRLGLETHGLRLGHNLGLVGLDLRLVGLDLELDLDMGLHS